MDALIAVEVRLASGARRFFVTWGRIQDAVDPEPVCEVVLRFARGCALGEEPVSARLCETLKEAADSDYAPYFYECFWGFSRSAIPFGDAYELWRRERSEAMEQGREIAYCGAPGVAR